MKPIKLTDAELDAVFSAARPLDPDLRDPFCRRSPMPCSRTVLVRSALAPWRASAARCSGSSSIRRTSTAPYRAGRVRVAAYRAAAET